MTTIDIDDEIHEANLGYLLLARALLRSDRPQALRRLGLADDVAMMLQRLSSGQVRVLAQSEPMLACLRHPQDRLWSVLSDPCDGDDDTLPGGSPAPLTQAQIDHELLCANLAHLRLLRALAGGDVEGACRRLNLSPAELRAVAAQSPQRLQQLARGDLLLASVRPLLSAVQGGR